MYDQSSRLRSVTGHNPTKLIDCPFNYVLTWSDILSVYIRGWKGKMLVGIFFCHNWGLNHLPFACEASALTTWTSGSRSD